MFHRFFNRFVRPMASKKIIWSKLAQQPSLRHYSGSLTHHQSNKPHSLGYLAVQMDAMLHSAKKNPLTVSSTTLKKGQEFVGLMVNRAPFYGSIPVYERDILRSPEMLEKINPCNEGGEWVVFKVMEDLTCIKEEKANGESCCYVHPTFLKIMETLSLDTAQTVCGNSPK